MSIGIEVVHGLTETPPFREIREEPVDGEREDWGRRKTRRMIFTSHPQTEWYKTTTILLCSQVLWSDPGTGMAGMPGALVGKTLMTGSDSKAKIIWRLLHSCIWYLGYNDTRAGLSELGQHMASPCGLGIVTAWWFQGSQFLKWGPGFQEQVPSEQEKSCMAFFCLVFFPFNNLMEI